ncbi:S-layer protein [Candidatus Micrarchaeota archaeon]|nr:S-layer protein [Candidatus Micrarchaeota archaeon]
MRLVNENGEALSCMEIDNQKIAALSEERLQILRMLTKQPMYAAEIARALGMEEQALYYHIKLLQKARLVKFTDYEEKKGGVAKKFIASSESIALVISNNWKHYTHSQISVPKIFTQFIDDGAFNGKFIVGSPDPHGKYRARASEFPILELAMLLGSYATFSFPLYVLDTQLSEADKKQNLIIAGGPKVNMLTAEINDTLPLRFDKATFEIYSKFSKKRYSGNIGVIELLPNPFAKNKRIMVVGGLNHHGTRAAIFAIIKKMKEVESGNMHNPKAIAKVVEGFDENGDGIVDAVEVLE